MEINMKRLLKILSIVTCLCVLLAIPTLASSVGTPVIKNMLSQSEGAISVQFNKITSVRGYQIEYSTDASFNSIEKVSTTKTSYTKKNLKPGTKYYIRIRAYRPQNNVTIYGDWSEVQSITTKGIKQVVKPESPANLNVNSPSKGKIVVNYDAVKDINSYEIQFAKDKSFLNERIEKEITNTTFTMAGLDANVTYFVRVRSKNDDASSDWSQTQTVIVDNLERINLTRSQWLSAVNSWCNYMLNDGDWIYSNSNNRKNVNTAIKESHTSNCALMVSHALQRAGILKKGYSFYSDGNGKIVGTDAWNQLSSVSTIIDAGKKTAMKLDLLPGDIVTWDGHVNVYIGKDSSGNLMWYDASSLMTKDQKHGSVFVSFTRTSNDVPVPSTGKPHIAYKIIRMNYKK